MARRQSRFINGVPELLILRLLSQDEMYGYQLVRTIRETTQGEFPMGEGVIYPLLHSLEADGFLKTRSEEIKGRMRHYYRLTRKGERRLSELSGEFMRVRDIVTSLLEKPSLA
ncbi:MAG: PadR family transcriptional regulator [Myxococcota bacterium]